MPGLILDIGGQVCVIAEAHATRGVARAISDLFGLSIAGTDRYIETIGHPDLTIGEDA